MRHRRFALSFCLVIGVAVAIAILPGCKRAPDVPEQPAATEPADPDMITIDLPQASSEIGVTLTAAPAGLVATYSGEHWIELADAARPRLLFTLVSDPQHASGVAVVDINDFEEALTNRDDGRFTGDGEIETALGEARWVSGSFAEDGEVIEQILVSAPHPSGSGRLTVSSTCPSGVATVKERLDTIEGLLEHVS